MKRSNLLHLPFGMLQESFERHHVEAARPNDDAAGFCDLEMLFPIGWNAGKQFEVGIDWLFNSFDQSIRQNSEVKREQQGNRNSSFSPF